MQWTFPSGTPATSSLASLSSRNNSSSGNIYSSESQPYLPGSNDSSTLAIRTLKANSRSLPHLQSRSSTGASAAESPKIGSQPGMSDIEVEELKRRKSEVLLPSSSYSGAKAAAAAAASGYSRSSHEGQGYDAANNGQLPHLETLTPQEQERLNEHRRSAHAILLRMTPSNDQRPSPEPFHHRTHTRSGSSGPALPYTHQQQHQLQQHKQHQKHQQMSSMDKERLIEHAKSTPELAYEAMRMKRSSNDPTDIIVQPLPSHDSRSGVQWFSQVNTPHMGSSPGLPLTPNDTQRSRTPVAAMQGSRPGSVCSGSGVDSTAVLPPILRNYDASAAEEDRQGRPRALSSHIHPLSRPTSQSFDTSAHSVWLSGVGDDSSRDRLPFDPTLISPRMERHLEERYYPIHKGEVLEAIERMEAREFLRLKAHVSEEFASEQFRNPEFLANMTAVLCVIRPPHSSWRNMDGPRAIQGGQHLSTNGKDSRRSSRDMEVDSAEGYDGGSDWSGDRYRKGMSLDDRSAREHPVSVEQPCRFALDIDMDSFRRDPEPDLRTTEGLTVSSLLPTKSFVAGFEPVLAAAKSSEDNIKVSSLTTTIAADDEYPRSTRGYPSNARLGRFYLPERAFRTPDSLDLQPDPNGPWVCCRFEEYRDLSVWVSEAVLEKYLELAQRHKMALTLIGAPVRHRSATHCYEDWEIREGGHYDIKIKESALHSEMVRQVWRDLYQGYHNQYQYQQQQQQQQYQRPSSQIQMLQGDQPPLPAHMANRVATYEEYQKSLWQADSRRNSYSYPHHPHPHAYSPHQQASAAATTTGAVHPNQSAYAMDSRQHPQSFVHREDLSSAPSSPGSPRHEDFQEDNQTNESASSTPLQHHRDASSSSSSLSAGAGVSLIPSSANMHRRISIAELCNPMQSLATERDRS
ncbi:hypothetical protein BGZ99_007220 [Dissophora globulifera]|uniref:Uncharacterized protein n=1 Tax=Dissophora globulifera TaxID=979702 RepID=A0A9P6RWE3_9FUNG|nr:hypothetical protein BGZ99_007220 [Dissophora globulifera]